MKTLITKRLTLRPLRYEDTLSLAPICADPEVMKYIVSGPYGLHDTEQRIQHWSHLIDTKGFGPWAILHQRNFLGFCGLIEQTIGDQIYIELGYRLAKAYWNHGFATEAASAVRDHALNELGMTHLTSIIHRENLASIRVAEKIGMNLWQTTEFQGMPVFVYELRKKD